jgi:hypothetical protein
MAYSGKFRPRNPGKYKGDPNNIVWRSTWELKLCRWFDNTPSVIAWASEEVIIPYISPIDGRPHRYFPDFWFAAKDKTTGKIVKHLVEVKPDYQTRPPKVQQRVTPRYLNEVKMWGVNEAKWNAAKDFCEDKGWKFDIITEKHLNIPATNQGYPRTKRKK